MLLGLMASPGLAQPDKPRSLTPNMTATVTVKSVDLKTRQLVVVMPGGETRSMKVPADIQRLGEIKPGQKIKATYTAEVEMVISPPNSPVPPNSEQMITSRAAKGELPKGAYANKMVIAGSVISIDKAAKTVKLINPKGGEMHTLQVKSPEGLQTLETLKVGDKITAYVSESMVLAVAPG